LFVALNACFLRHADVKYCVDGTLWSFNVVQGYHVWYQSKTRL